MTFLSEQSEAFSMGVGIGCVASGEHVYLCVVYVCERASAGRGPRAEGRWRGGVNSREADGAEGRRLMQQRD